MGSGYLGLDGEIRLLAKRLRASFERAGLEFPRFQKEVHVAKIDDLNNEELGMLVRTAYNGGHVWQGSDQKIAHRLQRRKLLMQDVDLPARFKLTRESISLLGGIGEELYSRTDPLLTDMPNASKNRVVPDDV